MPKNSDPDLKTEDFQQALKDMDTYIDVNAEDLLMLTKKAQQHAQLRLAEKLSVRDIMTSDVVTVRPDASLADAAKLLLAFKISGLPVVDSNGQLVGIVTEADFLSALGIPSHHPTHSVWQTLESIFNSSPVKFLIPNTVADIMSKNTVTINSKKTLNDVIDTMKRHHVKRLVVVSEHSKVMGIITRSNLVNVILQQVL